MLTWQVDFDQFLAALSKIADKKGQSLAEVVRGVLLAGGPTVNSTKSSYIKFHDDKVCLLERRANVVAKSYAW